MTPENTYRGYWERLFYFFPFQLVILHFKKNHLLLLFWLLLFGYITGNLATKYGVHYLFLYPEYLGQVSFWSYLIVGFSVGGFIMAFNIYTYIIHAYRFPFLATLAKPFYKFSVNNFVIPSLFVLTYLWMSIDFQRASEFESAGNIFIHVLGFLTGILVFMLFSFYYFFKTNKDIFKFLEKKNAKGIPKSIRPRVDWASADNKVKSWRVETYLKNFMTIQLARDAKHYDKETMKRVFFQNHINASIFEVLLVGAFLVVSTFDHIEMFVIPAGASVILVFTLLLMLISVFLSWFRGWTLSLIIVLMLSVNYFSSDFALLPVYNELYGLDYTAESATYGQENMHIAHDAEQISMDKKSTEAILEKWKQHNSEGRDSTFKPTMVFINSSGGGLRSALWTCTSLCELDERLQGQLMKRTTMMTGASGGMLGSAFIRESYLSGEKPLYEQRERISTDMGKDLLNPVLFSIASSDLFFRYRDFKYGGFEYNEDRAYKFEEQWLKNTGGGLDKNLGDYTLAEAAADIPLMILTPTIINDGRRLIVSSQAMSYMCTSASTGLVQHQAETENVEFSRLFANQQAMNTRYTSLLRANATFPYILPQVSLPSEPRIDLMDAGLRDNYGFKTTFQFIHAFQEWIEANTAGILIIQVRDKGKEIQEKEKKHNLINRVTSPLGNVYGNFTKTQDFSHDQMLQLMSNWLEVPLEEVRLQLEEGQENNISMSWHLTALEKQTIQEAIARADNQLALDRISALLN